MRFHIDPEFKTLIPPLSTEEYAQLEENIKAEGCRDPLVAWPQTPTVCMHCHEGGGWERFDYKHDGPDGFYSWLHKCGKTSFTPLVLLDGHNRFDICNHHEIVFDYTYAPDTVKTREDAKEWIIENQFGRRNLTPFQRGELSLKKEALVAEKARINKVLAGKHFGESHPKEVSVNLPEPLEPINTRKTLAEQAGVSEKTLAKVKHVMNNGPQELIEKARKGEVSIDKAFQEVKREEKRKEHVAKVEQARAEPVPPKQDGPFDLILADPPWDYDFQVESRSIENHYNTATVEEICQHCPPSEDDSVLLLWATAPKLLEALQVMQAWGFKYRTHAVWDKDKIGLGYWFRGQHELLLVGTKGNPGAPPPEERRSSVFQEPRRAHSQKPECVYEWIESAFPLATKLEMYCREPRGNWAVWGNEIDNRMDYDG